MSSNSIAAFDELLKGTTPIPLPAEPEPTGDEAADYAALLTWEATTKHINEHNRKLRFGALEARLAKERAAKLEAEKSIRDAARARYVEAGKLADGFAGILYSSMLEAFEDSEITDQKERTKDAAASLFAWLDSEFLMTGPTNDAPSGHAKGSRTMKRIAFTGTDGKGAREFDIIVKAVPVDAPAVDESGDAEPEVNGGEETPETPASN